MYNSTGLKIDKITMGGSSGRQTYYNQSDLDVIFCTPEDYDRIEMINYLVAKAYQNFKDIASIYTSSRAVHIDLYTTRCKIDLVYKHQEEFRREYREIKDIRQLSGTQQNTIKIVKYVFDSITGNFIEGYEIERACIQMKYFSLSKYVDALIYYFKGRLNCINFSVRNVINFLQSHS